MTGAGRNAGERSLFVVGAGAGVLWLTAGCTTPGASAPRTDIILTGEEQRVVEAHVSPWQRPEPQQYPNVLDYVSAVLVQREDPTPDKGTLIEAATAAMAENAPGAAAGGSSQRAANWASQVARSDSFAPVLADAAWADPQARRRGIEAGLQAMLRDRAWLLGAEDADALRQIVAGRESEREGAPAPFALRRIRTGVVYVDVPTFEDPDIGERVVSALRGEIAGGAAAVLIDLRRNAGGRPEQANALADLFLDHRPLQIMRFANGRRVTIVSHHGNTDVAVAVLTGRNTGSAAEMLAMALRDNDRATLVGERTAGALFGKECVDLPDGRMLVFRCEPTILSPAGADYSLKGIPPHVPVAERASGPEDAVIEAALETLLRPRSRIGESRGDASVLCAAGSRGQGPTLITCTYKYGSRP